MKPTALLLAASLLAGAVPALAGDRPGPDWMPLGQAHRLLTEAGYTEITEMEADDGRWEAEATREGRRVEVTVDPRTGAISAKPKR